MNNIWAFIRLITGVLLFCALQLACKGPLEEVEKPVKIIFDTDCGPDYDDVGAMALLHCLADSGKVEILATIASNKDSLVAPAIDILNTWFGRPDIPIGAPKGEGVSIGAWQHWPDSLVAKYSYDCGFTPDVEDAVVVYRRILSQQPDTSVTIVTVGFLTNLRDLLVTQPDSFSPLTGAELVRQKVKHLISMAGKFPEGWEFNVKMDSIASQYTFDHWPTQVVFTGFEIGDKIFTGKPLVDSELQGPVKEVFRISLPMDAQDVNGRMSWDQTAVLIAANGYQPYFSTIRGKVWSDIRGYNGFVPNDSGSHAYVIFKLSAARIQSIIEQYMHHQPK